MGSTFYGIEIGKTGLYASQKGLDVTAHNIANVDTAGYTRQRLVTTAVAPTGSAGKFASITNAAVGGGVYMSQVDQIRSSYLDSQYRTQQTNYSYWEYKVQGLSYVESLFEGTEASAIGTSLLNFFSAFNGLSTEANDEEQRIVLRSSAQSLCDTINQMYEQLVALQQTQDTAAKAVVSEINSIAEQIAELNDAIYKYELYNGQTANDLRDKRNLLLDELSALTDITYYETSDNKMVVQMAGQDLVNHTSVNELSLTDITCPVTGNIYSQPCWVDDSGNITVIDTDDLGGRLKAYLELRDSTDENNPGVAYFIDQLNILARAIVEMVNEVHVTGWTHPGDGSASTTGVLFFEDYGNINDVNAGNLSLSQDILDSVYNIAASSEEVILDGVDGSYLKQGNNDIAKLLAGLIDVDDFTMSDGTHIGGLYSFYSNIEITLATKLSAAKSSLDTQQTLLLSIDNQRVSIAGVSLDEEMINLIKYQQAYSASSRIITAMDEALETLINKMGRVGL